MNFKDVNNILNLENTPDWGIINANPDRVEEFIQFLTQNPNLDKSIKFEFVELIIASMNEAILKGSTDLNTEKVFLQYIDEIKSDNYYVSSLDYWKSLTKISEYPVSKLL